MTPPLPLTPLETLYDGGAGEPLPLAAELSSVYGPLRLPTLAARPYVFANFVSTLDGVVALGTPGTGGDDISGGSREDRCVMGLLRAAADVVIIGAGTLRAFPRHARTPEAIDPPRAGAFAALRRALGLPAAPVLAVVTARGDVDLRWRAFAGVSPVLIVTTPAGARALASQTAPAGMRILVGGHGEALTAAEILDAVAAPAGARILLECGPRLMGTFFEARRVDELFLTVAPQVAGRDPAAPARAGFVAGALFLPDRPLWAELAGAKRSGSVLFLRYRFPGK